MVAAGEHPRLLLADFVHQEVLLAKLSRPCTFQLMSKRFGLPCPFKRSPPHFAGELLKDPQRNFPIFLDPASEVVQRVRGKLDASHGTSVSSMPSRPRTSSSATPPAAGPGLREPPSHRFTLEKVWVLQLRAEPASDGDRDGDSGQVAMLVGEILQPRLVHETVLPDFRALALRRVNRHGSLVGPARVCPPFRPIT